MRLAATVLVLVLCLVHLPNRARALERAFGRSVDTRNRGAAVAVCAKRPIVGDLATVGNLAGTTSCLSRTGNTRPRGFARLPGRSQLPGLLVLALPAGGGRARFGGRGAPRPCGCS